MTSRSLAGLAEILVIRLRDTLSKFEGWTNSAELIGNLQTPDMLMLGLRALAVPHEKRLKDILTVLDGIPTNKPALDETLVYYLKHEFAATGLTALVKIDWDKLVAERSEQVKRQAAIILLLQLVAAGIEVAKDWPC